jgi:MFS family permease
MPSARTAAPASLGLVVVAACLIALITFGARATLGLFLEPMSEANGWGRGVFAMALAIQNLLWGAGQPLAGALADRYGPAKVVALGAVVYFVGLLLMVSSDTPLLLYLSAGVLMGLGGAAASFTIVMGAVGRMISEERRSWALGLIVACSSLGMFIYAPLGQSFITAYGWPMAMLLVAASILLVLPLSIPFLGDRGTAALGGQTVGQALREAAGHRSYWLLVAGFFVCGYQLAFIQVHMPAYVLDQGIAPWVAGWSLGLVGLFNIVGSYASGVLGGRRSKKNLLCLIYLARAALVVLYVALPATATTTLLFAAAMGILWLSTVPLTSGLVALMFGPRYMTTLFGVVFFSHQIGAFIGVWLGGYLYDRTGSYDLVWWTSAALGVFAALVHWPILERPITRVAPAPA